MSQAVKNLIVHDEEDDQKATSLYRQPGAASGVVALGPPLPSLKPANTAARPSLAPAPGLTRGLDEKRLTMVAVAVVMFAIAAVVLAFRVRG